MRRGWELKASMGCSVAAIAVSAVLWALIPVTHLYRRRFVEAMPAIAMVVFAAFGFVFAISARRQRGLTLGRILLAWLCMLWNGCVLLAVVYMVLI